MIRYHAINKQFAYLNDDDIHIGLNGCGAIIKIAIGFEYPERAGLKTIWRKTNCSTNVPFFVTTNQINPIFAYHKISFKNRSHFNSFISNARTRFRYHQEWVNFREDLKRELYSPKPKEWEETLPKNINLWASQRLHSLTLKHGDSCCDNYRVARIGNGSQERRYRRQLKHGCCGFFDCTEICPIDGNVYALGFNYGH